ncbi:MAG: hypothetical protein QM741_14720 [Rudaea sp.]|uniref:DUF7064 domain-containing protein n=1 Tax=Rudaea sp. TaxID=2136325 RepID=UPI0039E64C7B
MFDNKVLADPSLALDIVHDGRHALRDTPKARESVPYLFNLPEQGIAGFTYTWVSRASEAGAILALFGPAIGPTPIVDVLKDRPVPADMGFDDWRLEGLSMKQDLKFDRAEIAWKTATVDLHMSFEAFHPPYAYGSHARGCMPYIADDRIEQSGRLTGTLKLGGKVFSLDGTGHRDHSWGTRDWGVLQHYKWVQAQAGTDIAVHFWQVFAMGGIELRGYVYKGGRMAQVTHVDFDFDFEGKLDVKTFKATITDTDGRVTQLSAKIVSRYQLYPDPAYCLNESAGYAVIDDKQGVAWAEMFWPDAYRNYIGAAGPF